MWVKLMVTGVMHCITGFGPVPLIDRSLVYKEKHVKNLLEILTDPHPSPRDVFIMNTAKAIVLRSPRSGQADALNVSRALCVAVQRGIYPVPVNSGAYGFLYAKILEACVFYRRVGKW